MDILAQIMSEKHPNPIEFLNQLRQTTEPIGGGMEYSDNGEYVEYDVAVEAIKKAQQQLTDKVCEWIKEHNADYISIVPNDHLTNNFYDDLRKAMKGE